VHEVEPKGFAVEVVPREKEPMGHNTHWGTLPTVVYQDPAGQTVHEDAPTAGPPKALVGVVVTTPVGFVVEQVVQVAITKAPVAAEALPTPHCVHEATGVAENEPAGQMVHEVLETAA